MSQIAGMVSGLIGEGQNLPTLDMSALYETIKNAGAEQQSLINALPPEIQKNLQQYVASQNAAGSKYQGQIETQGKNYLSSVGDIYGPGSDAATAENTANKMQIYSTVPGSQNAIRSAMAASGGMSRGNAGAALAQPYEAAASQYGQAAANVNARQTQQQQQARQQALQVVNTMETGMFQSLFGMSKDQAHSILTTGNQALQDQLSQLLTESANRENSTLGLEGVAAQNAYQNAAIRNAQQAAVWNGLASPFTGIADSAMGGAEKDAGQGFGGWLKTLMSSGGGGSGGGVAGGAMGTAGGSAPEGAEALMAF